VSRALEKGETQGFIKICVDAETKQILGAAILGVGGDEVIHALLDVVYAKAPYTVIQRAMHIHPTVSDYLPTCEVRRGLIARPRSLSPWMFYDAEVSRLFERITALPEYYPPAQKEH
jgi:hypothetical protein